MRDQFWSTQHIEQQQHVANTHRLTRPPFTQEEITNPCSRGEERVSLSKCAQHARKVYAQTHQKRPDKFGNAKVNKSQRQPHEISQRQK